MASYTLVLALRVDGRAAVDAKNLISTSDLSVGAADPYGQRLIEMVRRELKAVAGGVVYGNLFATILDSTAALPTGNIACTRANAAGNVVNFVYGGKTITLTEGVDFLRGADDTATAANLAAAINAHAILGKNFTALGASGNCGLTGKVGTSLLHDFAMTTDDATAFAFTQLTGGTEGAAQFVLQQFRFNKDL